MVIRRTTAVIVLTWATGCGTPLSDDRFSRLTAAPDGSLYWGGSLVEAQQVSVGTNHLCLLLLDDTVVCEGILDASPARARRGPFDEVSAGFSVDCGTREGQVSCWSPYPIQGMESLADQTLHGLSTGGDFACALDPEGRIVCWGELAPVPPQGTFTQVPLGAGHGCAHDGQQVVCWGNDNFGETSPPDLPAPPTQVSAGMENSCARLGDGSVHCWGEESIVAVPPDDYGSVAVGNRHACATREPTEDEPDLKARCWGTAPADVLDVPYAESFVAVSAGYRTTCALTQSQNVYCWGQHRLADTPFVQ